MIRSFCIRFTGLFILLFILTIPFHFNTLSTVSDFLSSTRKGLGIINYSSDSKEMYWNTAGIIFISLLITTVWLAFSKQKNESNLFYWTHTFSAYILAFFLLKYGFDKLFKHQFYLPEPNTLYTPAGLLSKDILFWTSMGSSHSYNVFMGLIEIIPGLLLLFKRTRMLGAFISFGVLTNVLMINIGFDISVKILSCFLLLLTGIVLQPYAKSMFLFFFQSNPLTTERSKVLVSVHPKNKIHVLIKSIVIYLLLFESIFPFIQAGNYNDDLQKRPLFHGAYQITNNENLNSSELFDNQLKIKRIFIHRKGYFIVQYENDSMKDFPADLYTLRNRIGIKTPKGIFHLKINANSISWEENSKKFILTTKKLNWRKLPLMKDESHWITEY